MCGLLPAEMDEQAAGAGRRPEGSLPVGSYQRKWTLIVPKFLLGFSTR
jgi:hypothetical protein